MRDFNQTFRFSSRAAEAEMRFAELVPELGHLEAEIAREQRRVPAGLLAAAVLAALADDKEHDASEAEEAWLDGALEDSFPASDPIASNRYN